MRLFAWLRWRSIEDPDLGEIWIYREGDFRLEVREDSEGWVWELYDESCGRSVLIEYNRCSGALARGYRTKRSAMKAGLNAISRTRFRDEEIQRLVQEGER